MLVVEMPMLIHDRNGAVRARCEDCGKLYAPGPRELRSIEERGSRQALICGSCIAEAWEYGKWLDWQREKRERMRG